jgi:small subunit ribosomal protein S6
MTQPYYETMYILRPDIPEEEVDSHIGKYRDLVIESGGEVLDTQMRGKRRLAYQISKHREGIYVQLNHNGDGQQVGPLERAMRLSEDVIRYLTVKQTGPLPAPRAMVTTEAVAASAATAPAVTTPAEE